MLYDLTAEDLKDIGVRPVGHRRKLLAAIAALRSGPESANAHMASPAPAPGHASDVGGVERRQLTVVFCDLVGSTALSTQLDPEDLRELLNAYHACCARHVTSFDGYIAQYMGDGVLAYFDYPQAHEDDPARAIRAGLAILATIHDMRAKFKLMPQLRIGIATGLVVVGDVVQDGVASETKIVGETPNLSARLQSLAEPGCLVISDATRRLAGPLFEYRDLGVLELKGFEGGIQSWRITGTASVESRFEALHDVAATPLVGRAEELDLLWRRWDQAKNGGGRILLLSGEAGIGKSRLLAAFEQRLASEAHTSKRYFCAPHYRDSPLYPVIAHCEQAAGFEREDSSQSKLDKLEALLGRLGEIPPEEACLFADLLSLPVEGRYPPPPQDPKRKRAATLIALLNQLEVLTQHHPVLMVFEDVHWVDSTSLEFLDHVVERALLLRMMLVITFRPEFAPPWTGQAHVSSLSLSRLARDETADLVNEVTGGKTLPPEILDQVIGRTDGIPLFVEELTKSLLESELLHEQMNRYTLIGPLPPFAIPSSLRDSLTARLDRLAPVKQVAQIGAALGREFSFELIAAVARRDDDNLREALDQLTNAGIVFRRGTPPHAMFMFKHALVQEAAYSMLLRSQRQELHLRIAKTLEGQFPETVDSAPEILAHHFDQAGLLDTAIFYWRKAGERSRGRSALVDATAHFRRATELAEQTADRPSEQLVRLAVQIDYANAQLHLHGPASSEPITAFARAREIAKQVENAPERFSAYYGLFIGHYLRGELVSAREVAAAMVIDVERLPGSPETSIAQRVYGMVCHAEGNYICGRAHLQFALSSYDPERDRGVVWFGVDTGVATKCILSLAVWPLGDIERSHSMATDALAHAERLGHIPTMAFAHSITGMVAVLRRDSDLARLRSDDALGLARKYGMPLYVAIGTFVHGWANWHTGYDEGALIEMREGCRLLRSQGVNVLSVLALALLAEAEAIAGRAEDALALIDNILAETGRTGIRLWDAEIHRLRGEILQKRTVSDPVASEAAFGMALDARDRKAKSFELRAAVALANLYRATNRRGEIQELLEPVLMELGEVAGIPEQEQANKLLSGSQREPRVAPPRYPA